MYIKKNNVIFLVLSVITAILIAGCQAASPGGGGGGGGTTTTVSNVKDIYSGANSSFPGSFEEYNGLLYFNAKGSAGNDELWQTDGSTSGTVIAADIDGTGSSIPEQLTVYDGDLYMNADDGIIGEELYRYDGTSATPAANITGDAADSFPRSLTTYTNFFITPSNGLYFMADGGTHGSELWVYDGSSASRISDINGSGDSAPLNLTVYNGDLYFGATDGGSTVGREVWRYYFDLNTFSTQIVSMTDINSGSGDSNPSYLTVYDNKLYFAAEDGSGDRELYSYDANATPGNQVSKIDINPAGSSDPDYLFVYDGRLYFNANNATLGNGNEIYVHDSSGTSIFKDINSGSGDSDPQDFAEYKGKMYFSANDGNNGAELWVSDGTASGTMMVEDINPGSGDSDPSNLTVFNGKLYFSADDGSTGDELWVLSVQ